MNQSCDLAQPPSLALHFPTHAAERGALHPTPQPTKQSAKTCWAGTGGRKGAASVSPALQSCTWVFSQLLKGFPCLLMGEGRQLMINGERAVLLLIACPPPVLSHQPLRKGYETTSNFLFL